MEILDGCPCMPREGWDCCFSSDMNQQEPAEVCKTCVSLNSGLLQEILALVLDLPANDFVSLGKTLTFFESQFLLL